MARPAFIFRRLLRDETAATVVEFALVGPILAVLMLGVLHAGIALQNYNAVRNVSAEVARYTMVQYQTGNKLTNDQVRTFAINTAQGAPYLLHGDRVNAVVEDAATQRVAGAREIKITVTYEIESLLEFIGVEGAFVSYSRPIFVVI